MGAVRFLPTLFLCVICLHGSNAEDDGNVLAVGGTPVPRPWYPFKVLIEFWSGTAWTLKCHGIILDVHTVLTSRVCFTAAGADMTKLQIVAGVHNRTERETSRQVRQICHGEAMPAAANTNQDAYAVYHLSDPFKVTVYVKTANLPHKAGLPVKQCQYVSWAGQSAGNYAPVATPMHVTVNISADCPETHASVVCADAKVCGNEDFGSPLVCALQNRHFVYGLSNSVPSGSGACNPTTTFFAKLDNPAFITWLKEKVVAAETKCRPIVAITPVIV